MTAPTATDPATEPERLVDVAGINATLRRFTAEREWDQFHSPKNLAMALTGEVGELVEIFQWLTEEQSKAVMEDPTLGQAVRDEVADVFIYLVRLADVLRVDLDAAVRAKLASNAARYPADQVRGSNKKHGRP